MVALAREGSRLWVLWGERGWGWWVEGLEWKGRHSLGDKGVGVHVGGRW